MPSSLPTTLLSAARSSIQPILYLFSIPLLLLPFLLLSTTFSRRIQSYFIYLHWLKPPNFLYPVNNLRSYKLASSARLIHQKHLLGWHLLPPGPPFSDGTDPHFDALLAAPNQRIILFFHGNTGNLAFPPSRIDFIRFLASHLQAHIVQFDYSGFGQSKGTPSAEQLFSDARNMAAWLHTRVHLSSDVIFYGHSLGSFPAVHFAAAATSGGTIAPRCQGLRVVLLAAAPSSIVDAAMTYPVARLFRFVPRIRQIFEMILKDNLLDNTTKVGKIGVPLLILHGEIDGMISVEQGKRLYQSAVDAGHEHVEFVTFPECGHNDVTSSPIYLRVVQRFLNKHLRSQCKLEGRSALRNCDCQQQQ